MATVQQIYIAIFGRPADPGGLAFWNDATNNGQDLSVMLTALTSTPEYQERFEGLGNEEVISSLYQSLFGREPDADGLAFFTQALASGELTLESIAVGILDGAQNDDLQTIDNKTAAADAFTASLDTPEEIAAYSGATVAAEAQEFLSEITSDPATIPTEEEVAQAVAEVNDGDYNPPTEEPPPGGGGGGGSQVFVLTTGEDNFTGGASNDIFVAQISAFGPLSPSDTLNPGDSIDGGGGEDVLNLTVTAPILNGRAAPLVAAPSFTIENIERLELSNEDFIPGAFSLSGFESVDTVYLEDDVSEQLVDIASGQIIGFAEYKVSTDLAYVGDATEAVIELDTFVDNSTVSVVGWGLTTVSLSETAASSENPSDPEDATLYLDGTSSAGIDTVNVSLASTATIGLGAGLADTLETFNAAGSTGDLYVQFYQFGLDQEDQAAATAITSISTGSGDDVIVTANAGPVETIGAGGGDDVVYLTGRVPGTVVDLGEGDDILQIYRGLINVDGDTAAAGMIAVTNFGEGDQLGFVTSDAGAEPLEGTSTLDSPYAVFNGSIDSNGDLDAALAVVAADIGTGHWTEFTFNGDTYVYQNLGDAGFGAGDGLIQLVGVTDLPLDQIVALQPS